MKLPRDVSGRDLVKLLMRYGYSVVRQSGSHIRLSSKYRGTEHHVTIPDHDPLRLGTLASIVDDVAEYLQKDREQLRKELFG